MAKVIRLFRSICFIPQRIPDLIDDLRNGEIPAQSAAAKALGRRGARALPDLASLLAAEDVGEYAKGLIVEVLAKIGTVESLLVLAKHAAHGAYTQLFRLERAYEFRRLEVSARTLFDENAPELAAVDAAERASAWSQFIWRLARDTEPGNLPKFFRAREFTMIGQVLVAGLTEDPHTREKCLWLLEQLGADAWPGAVPLEKLCARRDLQDTRPLFERILTSVRSRDAKPAAAAPAPTPTAMSAKPARSGKSSVAGGFSIEGSDSRLRALVELAIQKYRLSLDGDFAAIYRDILTQGRSFGGCVVGESGAQRLTVGGHQSTQFELPDDYEPALESIGRFFHRAG
jgi:hypothetical protein